MSETGRYVEIDMKTGKRVIVEPIDETEGKGRKNWGDIDPASKTVSGDYGNKYTGAIKEEDSIITKENGFDDIHYTKPGVSPK